jgi:uncharacterized protein
LLALRRSSDRILFAVRVTPRAARSGIAGERDGALLVRVTAAPTDGAANEAVVRLIAKVLDIAPSSIRLEHGGTARSKVLSVPKEAEARLVGVLK